MLYRKIIFLFVVLSFFVLFGCLGTESDKRQISAVGSVQDGLIVSNNPEGIAQSVDELTTPAPCKKTVPVILVDVNGVSTKIDSILPYSINSKLSPSLQLTSDVTIEAVSSYDDGKGSGWMNVVDVFGKSIGSKWIEEGKSLVVENGKITVESFFTVDC